MILWRRRGAIPGQPDLPVHVPVYCRGDGLDDN